MSIFPRIEHINDLLPHIQHKPELRVRTEPNGFTVVCYMIAGDNTFDDAWSRECRGILFDPEGRIHHRTMTKFFNVGERESTRKENLDWSQLRRVMDKRDGSMITTSFYKGELMVKSKKSFDSLVAQQARAFISARNNYANFIKFLTLKGMTPSWEWTTPRMRIVLPYERDMLTLLHIRDNVTGEYIDYTTDEEVAAAIAQYLIPVVDIIPLAGDDLFTALATMERAEGYVVQFNDGEMVKLKCDWYLNLHRTMTFVRERDIAELVINEQIDDLKDQMRTLGVPLDEVLEVEARAVARFNKLIHDVESVASTYHPDIGFKDFAIANKDHPLFGLIMHVARGKEPDYKDHFLRHVLREEFTLEQLGSTLLGEDGYQEAA
jgi:RNA ligase